MTAQYAEITSIVKELRDQHGTIRDEMSHISGSLVESQPQEGDDEETQSLVMGIQTEVSTRLPHSSNPLNNNQPQLTAPSLLRAGLQNSE